MKREDAFAFTEKCYNGEPATCTAACPFHLDIKTFLKKASKGRLSAASQELHKALPFPVVISELCPAPCEAACQRKTVLKEETIAIRLLEKTCLREKGKPERKAYQLESLPQKIAVVGAGGVGLACALHLSRKRFAVTVFEKDSGWGGSLRRHERFSDFEEEFTRKFADSGVSFRFGSEITDPAQLKEFDAVFLATGKDGNDFGLLSGWDPELGTTAEPKVFLSGEMAGLSLIGGMAHVLDVAKAMESWIQTGNPSYAAVNWEKTECARNVPHNGEQPKAHVIPSGDVYTKEEAAEEADRCMQCDCEECFKSCDLLTKFKKKPPRIAIDVAQDGQTRNSVSSACITRQTWSCNLCGHCARVCEEGVDVGGLFELSRKDRVDSKLYPPAFHGYWLKEMEQAVSDSALLRPAPGFEESETQALFFPGCRLGGADPQYTLRSYEALLSINDRTGIWLGCCGVPALWAGEADRFAQRIEQMREDWERLGSPAVIYACASCQRTFARFLPEVPLISLYEVLEKGVREGKLDLPEGAPQKLAVFDPCAAYGLGGVKSAVRELAKETGMELTDYDSAGRCCGFGGHIQLANPSFYDEVAEKRCAETEEPFLTYCVNCAEVFASHQKPVRHILDLVFGRNEGGCRPATLEEKHENNLMVKKTLMEKYWNESFAPEREPWEDLPLEIPEEVQKDMERLLIPLRDVKQTIWQNEEALEGFENEQGEILCRLPGEYITCWVKYRQEGETFRVREVYAHRMSIREEEH